jgi:hypothetical protein
MRAKDGPRESHRINLPIGARICRRRTERGWVSMSASFNPQKFAVTLSALLTD